ncbi:MAG: hypothetical protein Q8865_02445 [Bacillota bacterium]|nr:hypothetical protein [Bacillota bacterium]
MAAAISVFLVILPVLLHIVSTFSHAKYIVWIIKISIAIGIILFLTLFVLLKIEQRQDRKIIREYKKNTKIRLESGYYECQTCGFNKLSKNDEYCRSCGIRFS